MTAKKIILVTGATAGIGKATALHLHAAGHQVIATGRNEKALAELKSAGLQAIALDVTSQASIDAAKLEVDRLTNGHGLDALVNNAGYGLFGPVEELSDADVRAQFDTNVFGLLAVTRAFVPAMRKRGAGRVINVSSVGGRMVFPLGGVYHATKYALEALTNALRMELHQFGIRVSVIEPGYIKTEFTSTTMSLLRKYVRDDSPYAAALKVGAGAEESLAGLAVGPESVARAIEHAATSRWPRARYVAPFYNAAGPWLIRLLPTWLTDWAFRRTAGLNGSPRLPSTSTTQTATA